MKTQDAYSSKPWLVSYETGVPEHLDYERITLPEILDRSVADFPDRDALVFMGYRVTFRQMEDMVERFATFLHDRGIRRGDRVALVLPNIIPCAVAYYAVLKIGAIVVMNNPLYTDTELLHQFSDSGARVAVVLDLLADRIMGLKEKCSLEAVVVTSIGDYLPFPLNMLFPVVGRMKKLCRTVKPAAGLYFWKEVIRTTTPHVPPVSLTFDDIAALQYTGGTTGVSKGAILTHGNLSSQIQQLRAWFPTFKRGEETVMGALPFFHIFGMTCAMNLAVYMAWTDVLVPKPLAEPLLENIKRFRPSFAALVPTMYIGMLNHPHIGKTDISCFKGLFSGSAPLPVEVIRDFQDKTGALIVEGFGMTETCPVTHVNPFVKGRTKVGSVGVPVPDTECRIVRTDDPREIVPVDQTGELMIRGPQVTGGYWNMPDETARAFTDGWLHTGDVARMDSDGYFYIVDRIKDMIIVGGMNVYPRDIEEILYEHPAVEEACAIGIPHPSRGEQVKVFIVVKKGFTLTDREVIDFCGGKLARYKVPAVVEFRESLPKSTVGKILRRELRAAELAAGKK